MKTFIQTFFIFSLLLLPFSNVSAQEDVVLDIEFPVQGPHSFVNDFDHSRGDHMHEATDILADRMTPIVSATDGVVTFMPIPEPSWGYAIYIDGDDGYSYHYLHLNNDTPGTDDGNGGVEHAYADGVEEGARVERGQLLGWVGDSGNAEHIATHLHFEIEDENGNRVNPYYSLVEASSGAAYDSAVERDLSETINMDLQLEETSGSTNCESNTLIKSPSVSSVYYCGADGKRYVFPSATIYESWYDDFSTVQSISEEQLASIPVGGNVTYKPGQRLVKIQTDPRVYAVAHGGVLRWVQSPEIAESLYGPQWGEQVDDIPEAFFISYEIGDPISAL